MPVAAPMATAPPIDVLALLRAVFPTMLAPRLSIRSPPPSVSKSVKKRRQANPQLSTAAQDPQQ
jgi:hypothetical protein